MAYDSYFSSDNQYIFAYLNWIDLRIKKIFEEKLNKKEISSPLKGLILTNDDIQALINNHDNYYKSTPSYNILDDEYFLNLENKTKVSLDKNIDLRVEKLCSLFNLNIAEKVFIILSIAAEVNSNYEKIYGFFNDNINKTRPTIKFALDILGIDNYSRNQVRESFYESSKFKNYILSYTFGREDIPLFSNEINLDDKIINYILEIDEIDKDIKDAISDVKLDDENNIDVENSIISELEKAYYAKSENKIIISLIGEAGVGKKEHFKCLCTRINQIGQIINLKPLLGNVDDFRINIRKAIREVLLSNAILALDNYEELINIEDKKIKSMSEKILFNELMCYDNNIIILTKEKIKLNIKDYNKIDFEFKNPEYKQRLRIWNYYLNKFNVEIEDVSQFATKFEFNPMQIKNTVIAYKTKLDIYKGFDFNNNIN